jgi:predicted dehydrogenase
MKKKCWLLGAGYMANEYIRVLEKLDVETIVIGRGASRINLIKEKYNIRAYSGGLSNIKLKNEIIPDYAIVAVSTEELSITLSQLINLGVKNILLEKPGALCIEELSNLSDLANINNINVYIAYNRRFYTSIKYLKEKILEDGGISSINFEFTEWVDQIDVKKYPKIVLERFLICNSTHVIDTVFHLAGRPKELNVKVSNQNDIIWHPTGSLFMGFGKTEKNIDFSYSSNWSSAGRWSIEVLTKFNRFYLKPLEQLYIQKKGSVNLDLFDAEINIDIDYKPGLYEMVNSFFAGDESILCSIEEHKKNFVYYSKIAGY